MEIDKMIDSHCHLEQEDFDADRGEVIERCKEAGMAGVVTCCARPKFFGKTMEMVDKWKGFVFAIAGLHPIYVEETGKEEKKEFLEKIRNNLDKIKAVGEIGLDYYHQKGLEGRKKQKEIFREMIRFSREVDRPVVIHSRDAYTEAVEMLENQNKKRVLMHMFSSRKLVDRMVENEWLISTNTIILRSKGHRKIVRDTPIENLLLETDAPWLGPGGKRNEPTAVRKVAEKVAEIKKIPKEEVWKKTGENANRFFNLGLGI